VSLPASGLSWPQAHPGLNYDNGAFTLDVDVGTDSMILLAEDDTTNVLTPLKLRRQRTTAGAQSGGAAIQFEGEDSAGAADVLGLMQFIYQDPTATSEDTYFEVHTRVAGAAPAAALRVSSDFVQVPRGTTANPGMSFTTSSGTGFSKADGPPAERLLVSLNGSMVLDVRAAKVLFPDGSAAAPSVAFQGSNLTGFYFNPLGTIGLCLGGAEILQMAGDRFTFLAAGGNTRFECGDIYYGRDPTNGSSRIQGTKGVVCGSLAAVATNATDGFLYIPTCAGTPTGVPTAYAGKVAMIFDTTANKLWIYDGGWLGGTTPGAFT
jgi:hypothetical protein